MPNRTLIGWREWISLPGLEIPRIKAKVDTGARTSALHAFAMERYRHKGTSMVAFEVHPMQRRSEPSIPVEAEIVDEREVRSSSGNAEMRPVILMEMVLGPECWTAEVTLTRRDAMGFRMLLGRSALANRFLVDSGRSFLASPKRTRKKAKS